MSIEPIAPGPRALPFVGTLPRFWRASGAARLAMHLADAERFGDVIRYRVGNVTVHLLLHPDDIRHVLQENADNYVKGRGVRKMRLFLGDGLLTSEGETWRRQRRLAQPAFHTKRLQKLVLAMTATTTRALDRWERPARTGATIDVAREMARLTLGVVGETLFGADVSGDADDVGEALTTALDYTNRRLLAPIDLPPTIPTPDNLRFRRALATLDRVVYGVLEERRRAPDDRGDLLSMLMLARDEETGQAMSDRQLRDEVMTLILAGHETTANALAWTFYLLSKSPAWWRALRAEVDEVLAGRAPTYEDVARLRTTRMIVDEAMRLYPPAWMFGRRAIAEDRVRGYAIPARSIVTICPYVTHRHPAFWTNPEGFDPERFAPERAAARPRYAYLPFGGGPRICIGNAFALMEAQIVLAMTAQRFRLELAPSARVEPLPMVTLRPKAGVPMTVRAASA